MEILMPQMGESIQEATLTKWYKKVGDFVKTEEILFEISTDKVDTEIPSPVSGVLKERRFEEGAVIAVHSVVAVIDEKAQALAKDATSTEKTPDKIVVSEKVSETQVEIKTEEIKVTASPLVKKIAKEEGIDLDKVKGSGSGGKITKEDLIAHTENLKNPSSIPEVAPQLKQEIKESEPINSGVRETRVPLSPMRKKIAEHMVLSKRTSPHVTSVIEIDVQKIVDIREKLKKSFEKDYGFKLTYMPFFMKAALAGIKAVPEVNSMLDGSTLVYKKDVNLGVAVALEAGLIVPILKNAQEKSFQGIAKELNILAQKARAKKLSPDEVQGGTFSISNYGGFGTVIGQPIINQPQVAIMGLGAMTKKPVVVQDAIAIHTTCYVVLTFDHRIMDGSHSGKFLSTVKDYLENWDEVI